MLLELDAIGSSSCMERSGALPEWEADMRYEINAVASLPHTVVYIEGGYSDGNSPAYTAKVLNAVGVSSIRGFYTNDTHLNWTTNEIKWGEKVSAMTGGSHFIINTADNGRGPKLNPHPVKQGNEDLCNPPGRGAGPPTTTQTGIPAVDAFMWVHVPGVEQRVVQRRDAVRDVLPRPRAHRVRERERAPRSEVSEPSVLGVLGAAYGGVHGAGSARRPCRSRSSRGTGRRSSAPGGARAGDNGGHLRGLRGSRRAVFAGLSSGVHDAATWRARPATA